MHYLSAFSSRELVALGAEKLNLFLNATIAKNSSRKYMAEEAVWPNRSHPFFRIQGIYREIPERPARDIEPVCRNAPLNARFMAIA